MRAALNSLAVLADRPPAHLNDDDRQLRRGLRAKARQLGDQGDSLDLLTAECAYEQWHRLLFARFLVENGLLIHPDYGAPVTIDDCEALADSLEEPDGWAVAGRFAAEILPGIFRLEDPCVQLRLAPEGRLELEGIVSSVTPDVFSAQDSLGWVYQYWQQEQKDEINDSERKVGGADLGPVTQLFTENYMVRSLLENSLGAWWAARRPGSPLVKQLDYLRVDPAHRPAAGSFESWPSTVAEVTVMDPCCGSGHFLVEAFDLLWRMRAEEEGLSPAEAQDAVLRENLFGLELDPRCVQIAAFALALSAWKAGGYRVLPTPSIACSGIAVRGQLSDWKELAGGNKSLEDALVALHAQFRDAPLLGSLIDPTQATSDGTLFSVDYAIIGPLLDGLLAQEREPQASVAGIAAAGIAQAGDLLSRRYTLVATNVPYLGIQRMPEPVADFLLARYPQSSNDLATVFIERCLRLSAGSTAVVSPLGWLFLRYFADLRRSLLDALSWRFFAPLGKGAFESISGHVVQAALLVLSHRGSDATVAAIDATTANGARAKASVLRSEDVIFLDQDALVESPDTLLSLETSSHRPLSDFARSWQGLVTSDVARFIVRFWEVERVGEPWRPFLTAPSTTNPYAGRESLLRWDDGRGPLVKASGAHNFNPDEALGKRGVLVGQGSLRVTLYCGEMFNDASSPVIPYDQSQVNALWAYMSSPEYAERVRRINHKIIVGPGYLVKVPFDVERWTAQVEDSDLPEPSSNDPTQWLFQGRPEASIEPMQVGAGRLVGYIWPEQTAPDNLDSLADEDGIVCLPSVRGERTAAERLQEVLARAFGGTWSPARTQELLTASGSKKKDLDAWLRDDFFKAHCQAFKNRPFVWQVWDGRKDGFSVLVNYHRLHRPTLEKLTYSYLGDWIERQAAGVREDAAGAEERLGAARALQRKLELILEGEAPYDIYVRWKPLADQPIGWEPDLNDGVRLNIRPFVEAGILRSKFNVKWDKDRGKDLDGSERLNDLHYTLAEKRAARGESS